MQLPYQNIRQGLDGTSSDALSQSSAAASWDILAYHFSHPPQAISISMLLDDTQRWWSCHHSKQGSYGNTPWYTQSQSSVPAKLVAGLTLCPSSLSRAPTYDVSLGHLLKGIMFVLGGWSCMFKLINFETMVPNTTHSWCWWTCTGNKKKISPRASCSPILV